MLIFIVIFIFIFTFLNYLLFLYLLSIILYLYFSTFTYSDMFPIIPRKNSNFENVLNFWYLSNTEKDISDFGWDINGNYSEPINRINLTNVKTMSRFAF